jgi:hypothetical protein
MAKTDKSHWDQGGCSTARPGQAQAKSEAPN